MSMKNRMAGHFFSLNYREGGSLVIRQLCLVETSCDILRP